MAGDRLGRRPLLRFWPALAVAGAALVLEPMPAGIAIQGLIVGLVGALVAVGMALLYQSNRIVNFAQADLGLAPAVLAVSLAVYGGVSWFIAVPVGLVAAIALGCAHSRMHRHKEKMRRGLGHHANKFLSALLAGTECEKRQTQHE